MRAVALPMALRIPKMARRWLPLPLRARRVAGIQVSTPRTRIYRRKLISCWAKNSSAWGASLPTRASA